MRGGEIRLEVWVLADGCWIRGLGDMTQVSSTFSWRGVCTTFYKARPVVSRICLVHSIHYAPMSLCSLQNTQILPWESQHTFV